MPNASMLVSEYVPERCRSVLVTTMFIGFGVRSAVVGFAAGSLIPHIAVHTVSAERGLIVRHYSLVGCSDSEDDPRHTYRIAVQREDHARGSAHIFPDILCRTQRSGDALSR